MKHITMVFVWCIALLYRYTKFGFYERSHHLTVYVAHMLSFEPVFYNLANFASNITTPRNHLAFMIEAPDTTQT